MELEASIWNRLGPEGRLKNQWSKALAETDPDMRLNGLRSVLQSLLETPSAFVHLWMSFLDTFLDPNLISRLTSNDLLALEEMGRIISTDISTTVQIRPEHVWSRVIYAYDMRHEERPARTLLARIYYDSSATWQEKTRSARELAYRGALGDDYINIYLDYLHRTLAPAEEMHILTLLRTTCQADFDTDKVHLKRAKEIAQQLTTSRVWSLIHGLWTVQGIYALQVEQSPSEACRYFARAFEVDHRDKTAVIGLITSWIFLESYGYITEFTRKPQSAEYAYDPIIAGLVRLGMVLQWLDSRHMPEPLPVDAHSLEQIKNLGVSKYVGNLIEAALGRVYLLTGNAQRAAEILCPLVGIDYKQPRLSHYAAWAEMLVGKGNGVVSCFNSVSQWTGKWTVACRLLDMDQTLAEQNGAYSLLNSTSQTGVKPSYLSIIDARVALAQARQPLEVKWQEGGGQLEEDIEALRTALGIAFYTRDTTEAQRLIAQPLFVRLPLADQLLWRGLLAFYTDKQTHGLALLEKAVTNFAYHRAAMVLAVHWIEQNKLTEAKRYVEIAANSLASGTIGLLRAYIRGREAKIDEALGLLEQLTSKGTVKAHYMLSNLLLQKAAQPLLFNQTDYSRLYRKQAATILNRALNKGKELLPLDAEALFHCAQFVALPQQRTKLQKTLWSAFEHLDISQRQPWIKWNAVLAQMWYGSSAEVLAVEIEINNIIDSANSMKDAVVEVFAQALANVSQRVEQGNDVDKLVKMLERLSRQSKLQKVKQTCQLGITIALNEVYKKSDIQQRDQMRQILMSHAYNDPTNASLPLLLASANLENAAQNAAVTALRNARPQDEHLQCLYSCFADLLDHHISPPGMLPVADQNASINLRQAYDVLHIAFAYVSGRWDQDYEKLGTILQTEGIASLLDIGKIFLSLCAYLKKSGKIPPLVVEILHKLAQAPLDSKQAANLACCAAVIDQFELACHLWEQSLASDDTPDNPARQEYVKLLCHLATKEYREGNRQQAIHRLRQAAQWQQERVGL